MTRWPHSPPHEILAAGNFIVTASTLHKQKIFGDGPRLRTLHDSLLEIAEEFGWRLKAWAVFPNRYHFVGASLDEVANLRQFLSKLHGITAISVNKMDGAPGRTVWYRHWDTRISFQRSYMARLAYVHNNPVRHGLVAKPEMYPYCSADWFSRTAPRAFYETVLGFKIDRVKVVDDF